MILEKRNDEDKNRINWLVIEMKKVDLCLYINIYL